MSPHVQTVRVRIDCECGKVAVKSMTPTDARTFANAVLASCDGLRPVSELAGAVRGGSDGPGLSWTEWLADNGEAWPNDDDAPEAFRRIP